MVRNQLSLRFEEKLLETLKKVAEERNITLNGLIEQTMEEKFLRKNKYEVVKLVKDFYQEYITNSTKGMVDNTIPDYVITNGVDFIVVDEIRSFPVDDNDYVFECTYSNQIVEVKLIAKQ